MQELGAVLEKGVFAVEGSMKNLNPDTLGATTAKIPKQEEVGRSEDSPWNAISANFAQSS